MPVIHVESPGDPRLDPYRQIKKTNHTRRAGLFIAEGEKLAQRLLESRFPVHSLLVGHEHLPQWSPRVPPDLPLFAIPDAWVDALVGFNFHRGVLACGIRLPDPTLAEFAATLTDDSTRLATFVVCPNVQDPENVGGIFRLAAAFDVQGILLGHGCADPLSRRVLRVSMGASLRVPTLWTGDLPAILQQLQTRYGVALWATVTDLDADPLQSTPRPPRVALLLGSEGHGLDADWVARCDRRVTIPMRSLVNSLNVTAAAAIFLHHLANPA